MNVAIPERLETLSEWKQIPPIVDNVTVIQEINPTDNNKAIASNFQKKNVEVLKENVGSLKKNVR
jgi:hypothetical protein